METETAGRLKLIPESLLVDASPPQIQDSITMSTISRCSNILGEDLPHNFQNFINTFNQPLFAEYLMQQQQQPKIPLSTYPTPSTFFGQKNSPVLGVNSVGIVGPVSSLANSPTGSKDFIKCPLCSLIFRTPAFLNEHMRKEHSVLI